MRVVDARIPDSFVQVRFHLRNRYVSRIFYSSRMLFRTTSLPFRRFQGRLLLLAVLLTAAIPALGQRKLIKKLLSNEADTTRGSSFLPLPGLSYSQETGVEFGLVALYSFYTDRRDTLTRNSTITGIASVTSKKQYSVKLQADWWSPGNRWHHLSELRYKDFPFNFYGTGNRTREADKDVVVQQLVRVSHETERRLNRVLYGGLNLLFEHYRFRDKEAGGIFDAPITGKNGGKVLFTGISLAFDNRNTNTYTTKGSYLKLNGAIAPGIFGTSNFSGQQMKVEGKTFSALAPKVTLGLQANGQAIGGGQVPFYLLPQLGNDQVMRGYYAGRYRDNYLVAAQAELRYRFISRLGVVIFAGTGNVGANLGKAFADLKPSYGAGGRYFFDTARGLSVRVDYAKGERRPGEQRQSGFYLSLGEAF